MKTKKTILILLILLILTGLFIVIISVEKYMDRNTWATLQISGTVLSDTADAFDERREFLKGDSYRLHSTTLTIEDITHSGEVLITFHPAVIDNRTGEWVETATIGKEDFLRIRENCEAKASWQFRVISNRYR